MYFCTAYWSIYQFRMTEYQIYTFPNGIRLAHRQVTHTKIVHCGIMLDIGSRDELENQTGLAHFWEHMAFKGTQKRKAYQIINSLENVGGELNAYTTKEKICFYASVLEQHFDKALDVLADITFNSIFPEKQVEKERAVILEEMAMYLDSPEEAIQDDFDQLIFPNHALGTNILGTKKSVQSFTGDSLRDFVSQNINTEKIVVSIVGNIQFQKAIKVAEKYLKEIPSKHSSKSRKSPESYTPQIQTALKPISQAHVVMGKTAFSLANKNRFKFFTLIHLLGGGSMNSRLNISLREKNGLVYGIDASYSPFTDTGLLNIYFATDVKNVKKADRLIWQQIELLKNKKIGTQQLKNLKEQIMGQLAMADESNQGFMLMMAKSLLDLGRVDTLPEVFSAIKSTSAEDLMNLANETLIQSEFSQLRFLPEE